MFVVDFEKGYVGLDWRPSKFRKTEEEERVTWRVYGDSIENVSVEPSHTKKIKEGVWEIGDWHGGGSDLVKVEGLRKVEIKSIGKLTNPPLTVIGNPKEVRPVKGGRVIARLRKGEVPWTWSKRLKILKVLVPFGIGTGLLVLSRYI